MTNFIISFLLISICTLGEKIFTLHLGYDSERSGVGCVMKKDISKEKEKKNPNLCICAKSASAI